MRCAVPLLPVFLDTIVPEGRVHPAAALMLKRGLRERQASIAEAAAVILAPYHQFDAAFVFAPARRVELMGRRRIIYM